MKAVNITAGILKVGGINKGSTAITYHIIMIVVMYN